MKRATDFAQKRPKTAVGIVAGLGLIFLPRLTAITALGVGAAVVFGKKASAQTREMLRDRGTKAYNWGRDTSEHVLARARQLLPDKLASAPRLGHRSQTASS